MFPRYYGLTRNLKIAIWLGNDSKFNITIFTIFMLLIIHLVCPWICITIVFDFSGDACNTPEKLETIVIQNFLGGSKVYCGQCERIPPGRRKTIWLFSKLTKVLSRSMPVNKSSCWSEWSSKAAALDCEFSVLTTVSPKERIANVRWRKLLCSESTPDLVIFYPHKWINRRYF